MSIRLRSTALVAATAGGALVASMMSAPPAIAASPDVVISQVYGGGGNSGATLTNDYIELYNRGSSPVDITGWSVQYAASGGTTYQVTALTGAIQPGKYFLVREAAGAGGTTPLPTPDATGSIAMSATSGKVALVTNATALACGADCDTATGVRDFVGYGAANDFEGAAAPALSNTTAALRAAAGATDTDNNATDFASGTPAPRNSAGGGGGPEPLDALIRGVQGSAHRSPLDGALVKVSGVVTAVDDRGFYLQDPAPDDSAATSEAVFVFTSAAPTVAAGNAVTVTATVAEFRPGGATSTNLTTTELINPTVTVTAASAPLPAPTLVGPGGRQAPTPVRTDNPGDVETSAIFDPAVNALDFYESLEGMLVRVTDAVATGPTNDFGEISVLPGNFGSPRTVRGGVRYTYADANAERVILDDNLAATPTVNTGDRFPGNVDGVLDYSFGSYKLHVLATPSVTAGGIVPEKARPQRPWELAIATYNVENLDPRDPVAKFDRLAAGLVTGLASPDIVALEEVQDNTGPTNDGVVAADVTYRLLIEAILRAGGPRYDFRQVDPVNGADGGEPGGNIRVGFLFRTDRGVSFVDRSPGDSTTPTDVVRGPLFRAQLTRSPGRIDPTNTAFANSRKPLAGEFRFRGHTVFVVANHFNSKGGDQPLFGRFQPPTRSSEVQRHQQATAVRAFVSKVKSIDPLASVVVLGDINDFEFSTTTNLLVGSDGWLVSMPRTLPENERYSYVFNGNSQVLDQILVSKPALFLGFDYDVVHLNAEFADQASDHDPQVVRLIPIF